jgi:hypothetical protein
VTSYHDELQALAESIGSDGCTHALEVDVDCCWEHDWAYVTGTTPRGVVVTKAEADQRFRDCAQRRSSFRYFSPLSWWRWAGVRLGGRGVWSKSTRPSLGVLSAPWTLFEALLEARAARDAILAALAPGLR